MAEINGCSCEGCKYKEECIKENGPERDDGDDYRALVGTHHCLLSWEDSRCCGCMK